MKNWYVYYNAELELLSGRSSKMKRKQENLQLSLVEEFGVSEWR